MCKCGNCGVEGGTEAYKLIWEDLSKIVRLEDDNTETPIKGDAEPAPAMPPVKPSRKEIMDTIGMSIKAFENLPPNAMMAPVTHYDFLSLLITMHALFAEEQ